MEAKHTPEPWYTCDSLEEEGSVAIHGVRWGELATVHVTSDTEFDAEGHANAIRIVQCVNACAGLDMRNVPVGAVKRLVEEAFRLESTEFQLRDWDTFRQALAPFKE